MMRALRKRGHALYWLQQADLRWEHGTTRAKVRPLEVGDDDHDWYREGPEEVRRLADFAAVVMRKDPPFDMEYVYSTYLLEAAQREGARVFNQPRAIRDHNEKLAIAKFARVHHAHAGDARHRGAAGLHRRARRRHREAAGRHGRHVDLPRARRRSQPQRHRRDGGPRGRADGDGAALHPRDRPRRQAHPAHRRPTRSRSRWRASPSPARRAATWPPGAAARRARCPSATARSPRRSGRSCGRRACWWSGWTSSAPYLTEVNVTSPTCFVEIATQTGFDVGGMFADALVRAAGAAA